MRRTLAVPFAAVPLVLLPLLAGCTGKASPSVSPSVAAVSPSTSGSTSGPATGTATGSSTASPSDSPSPSASMTRVLITLANGKIQGPATITMKVGETVELSIATDRDATIHAHGFEVEKDIKAGDTASLILHATAAIVGAWPVEDHVTNKEITQIQVTP
ncbi:MAG: hypothetical protein QOK14_781 [Frankiaceae bacterium]|nr:hypothetical protein [Frankiaceae bacterium]